MSEKNKINVVLYEPEIVNNLGSIMRTCYLTNVKLHIIEPMGFIFDPKRIARSSANNFKECDYVFYDDWEDFLNSNENASLYYATRYAKQPLSDFDLKNDNRELFFVFGRESTGIPKEILSNNKKRCYRFPMIKEGRSLNISNAVSISLYEVLRQYDYLDLCKHETEKGEDYLDK